MPVSVRKSRRKSGGWDIVNTRTGRIEGHSSSKRKAEISAGYRNRAHKRKKRRKRRPRRRRTR